MKSNQSTSVDLDNYPTLARANYGLSLLFSAYVLSFLDRQILSLLVGPIRETLEITDSQYGLLMGSSFAIMYAVAGLPLGRMADRFSRRAIIAGSVLFWSVATCAGGLSKSFAQLFISRMGVGAGEAGLAPAAYSLISDSFRPQHFGYAIATYKLGVKVGGGLALLIGGLLYDYYSGLDALVFPIVGELLPWQATLISVGLPGVLLSLLLLTIPEPTRKGVPVSITSAGEEAEPFPMGVVLSYLWQRKRMYVNLFLGSSLLAMAGYGNAAWYPEFLTRVYGMSKTDIGLYYGTIMMVGGSIGVMGAAWVSQRMVAHGRTDGFVRTVFYASIIAIPFVVGAPLAGSPSITFLLLCPGMVLSAAYIGVLAASFTLITPNRMRGQATAIYIFSTSILGMALGISCVAWFTDYVFRNDQLLHYSLAATNAIFYPTAAWLFWRCMPAYRRVVEEAQEGWNI
jgi:MFS family permease